MSHIRRSTREINEPMLFLFAWGALLLCIVYVLQVFFPQITSWFVLQQDTLFSEPWRLVTALFLHGGFGHLTSNLVGFLLFGLVLESVIGSHRAVGFALLTGIGANIVAGQFYRSSLGASGLIFGLIGILVVLRPFIPVFAFGVPLPMLLAGIAWGVANIGGLFIESTTGYIAHLAGLCFGLLFGFMLLSRFGHKRKKHLQKDTFNEREFDAWERKYMG